MSGDVQEFPDSIYDYIESYEFEDRDEVYTNGAMLIPVFRVMDMIEHYFGDAYAKGYNDGIYIIVSKLVEMNKRDEMNLEDYGIKGLPDD